MPDSILAHIVVAAVAEPFGNWNSASGSEVKLDLPNCSLDIGAGAIIIYDLLQSKIFRTARH